MTRHETAKPADTPGVSWLPADPIPRVRCDCCNRVTYSRYDRRRALPEFWMHLGARDVCGACVRRLLGRRTSVRNPSCFACGHPILPVDQSAPATQERPGA